MTREQQNIIDRIRTQNELVILARKLTYSNFISFQKKQERRIIYEQRKEALQELLVQAVKMGIDITQFQQQEVEYA